MKCIHKLPRPFLEMSSCWHLLPLHSWFFASAQYRSLHINAQRRWTGLLPVGRWLCRCSLGQIMEQGSASAPNISWNYHDSVSVDRTQVIHNASWARMKELFWINAYTRKQSGLHGCHVSQLKNDRAMTNKNLHHLPFQRHGCMLLLITWTNARTCSFPPPPWNQSSLYY